MIRRREGRLIKEGNADEQQIVSKRDTQVRAEVHTFLAGDTAIYDMWMQFQRRRESS
jgi:hypothetical protein